MKEIKILGYCDFLDDNGKMVIGEYRGVAHKIFPIDKRGTMYYFAIYEAAPDRDGNTWVGMELTTGFQVSRLNSVYKHATPEEAEEAIRRNVIMYPIQECIDSAKHKIPKSASFPLNRPESYEMEDADKADMHDARRSLLTEYGYKIAKLEEKGIYLNFGNGMALPLLIKLKKGLWKS